jgi:SAM-dependent methyltransferase
LGPVELPFDGERFIPGMAGAIELEHIHRYALARELAEAKLVLDIACGEGYGSRMLADVAARVIGIDISDAAVAHARQTYRSPNLEYRTGSCAAIPLESGSVDLVVSFETIEHHDQHDEMLDEIARVLKPGGVLIISSPNKHEYSDVPGFVNPFHVKELYLEEFSTLLARRFRSVSMLGQRPMHASTIATVEPVRKGFAHFFAHSRAHAGQVLERPLYFLALATNGELPELPNSVMEASPPGRSDPHSVLVPTSCFQIYWRSEESRFIEEQSASFTYPVGADLREYRLRLALPPSASVGRLRIDFADQPLVMHLVLLSVFGASDEVIWQWNRDDRTLENPSECFSVPRGGGALAVGRSRGGLDLVSTGIDPHFEVALSQEQSARLSGGAELRAQFASSRLLPSFESDALTLLAEIAAARREAADQNLAALRTMAEMAQVVKQAQAREDEARVAANKNEAAALRMAEQMAQLMKETQAREAAGQELADQMQARVLRTMAEANQFVKEAQARELEARNAAARFETDALEARERTARSELRWARLERQRWWPLLNRWLRLDQGE